MKKLITSALPYVNNVPHLGNIIGCVLSADVYARFCRSRGYETLYVCGNDEYGTATENKAREEGLSPEQICEKYHAIHAQIYREFNISFDSFGRTSTEEQTQIAQSIFKDLQSQGYISEQTEERTFCEKDGLFLADRYVEGHCPFCAYEDARGDQCDQCSKLLEPEKLLNPRCKFCGTTPGLKETSHLYLNLDSLQEQLAAWCKDSSEKGGWSHNAVQTTAAWLERGLEARPITRDLKWGIPVPCAGYENKVFYVWFDAPIGYISITAKLLPETWKCWWQNPKEVELYQFMAKDNIPFHTVIFPASLLGSGKNWTMLHHINSTEYLNYEGNKFSKSRQIGVFGDDIAETGLPNDLWRFYLLLLRPEKTDSDFNWAEFYERVNSEFINNLGNLVNRSLTYLFKNFEGEIIDQPLTPMQADFVMACKQEMAAITKSLEAVKLRDGLRQILSLSNRGNKFFHDCAPWSQIKADRNQAQATVSLTTYLVRSLAIVLEPYMPITAARILKMLNLKEQTWRDLAQFEGLAGHFINEPEILYRNLNSADAEMWRKRFSGNTTHFGKFHLRVGQVQKVSNHPKSEHLYVLAVDCGDGKLRQIVAGLKKHYSLVQMQDRKVIILANLAVADIHGVSSQGMVLVCVKRNKMELLDANDSVVGELACSKNARMEQGEIDLATFKAAPFRVAGGVVFFDEQEVTLNGKLLRTLKLLSGKVK